MGRESAGESEAHVSDPWPVDPTITTQELWSMSRISRQLDEIICLLEAIDLNLDRLYKLEKSKQPGTSVLTLTLPGGAMSVEVGATGTATVQFADANGNPGPGPNDSVTGEPIVPVVTSSDTSVATIAAGTAGATAGLFDYEVTGVAVGSYTGAITLTDSSGNPVVDSAGNPYTFVDTAPGTVTGGATTEATLTLP
jgi:hypothetical protein